MSDYIRDIRAKIGTGLLLTRYTYPNGDTIEPTILLFECMTIGGALECVDGESLELQYFDPADIDRISGFHELDFLELTANPFQWDDE